MLYPLWQQATADWFKHICITPKCQLTGGCGKTAIKILGINCDTVVFKEKEMCRNGVERVAEWLRHQTRDQGVWWGKIWGKQTYVTSSTLPRICINTNVVTLKKKVKVVIFSSISPKAHWTLHPLPPGIGTHSLSLTCLGRMHQMFSSWSHLHSTNFFVPPGTHYCWVARGGVDSKLA